MAVTKEIWVNINKLVAIGSKILTLSYIASKSLDEMLNESCVLFFSRSKPFIKVSFREIIYWLFSTHLSEWHLKQLGGGKK